MNIAIVVLFGGSLKSVSKIVLVQSIGLKVTVTTMESIEKDGTMFTPTLDLRRMLRINGTKVTEEMKANGND